MPAAPIRRSFWDNLIPLKPSTAGRQFAGWEPGPPAMVGLGCIVLASQEVPIGEITLNADLYLPKEAGRYPAVIAFSAYSSELHTAGVPTGTNEIGSPPVFTNHGYAHVIVERRGMGRSTGDEGIFFCDQDVDDHEAVIAWCARQSWCDGNVVMFGTSYYACSQLQVAARRPFALKAFFCNEVTTDYHAEIMQFGGVFGLYFLNVWLGANFTRSMYNLRVPPLLRALASQITNSRLHPFLLRQVSRNVDALFARFMKNTPTRKVREWYVQLMIDGKTRDASIIPNGPRLSEIDAPFVVVHNLGEFNLHQWGAFDLFERAGTPSNKKWMILASATYELPVFAWQLEAIAFFDHVLRGMNNGYAEQPAVRYWVEGADAFSSSSSFPSPDSEEIRFYLASGGVDGAVHRLTTEPFTSRAENSWAAIPLGAPILGGIDEVTNQTLVFDAVMDVGMTIAGPVILSMRFSSNEIDSEIIATLGRVDAAGTLHRLSIGAMSPASRRIDPTRGSSCQIAFATGAREPLTPGEPITLTFSLTPFPTCLRAGEKLRLQIGSRTDIMRGALANGYTHFNIQAPPYFSRNTVHYGDETFLKVTKTA